MTLKVVPLIRMLRPTASIALPSVVVPNRSSRAVGPTTATRAADAFCSSLKNDPSSRVTLRTAR